MASMVSMVGVRAPSLIGRSEDWINTDAPIRNWARTDIVYLVDFWDYTCVNCLRTLPYVKEWHERYKPWGLVVIGVHTPEFEFAKSRAHVQAAVRRLDIKYPVLVDSEHANWSSFSNRYWPREYLVEGGRIVYDHIGEGGYGETEATLQRLIRKLHPEAMLPDVLEPVRPEDEPGAVCYPMTQETYAGYYRGVLGNPEGFKENMAHAYSDAGRREDGVISLRGTWLVTPEAAMHARETHDPEDYVAIQYHAIDVNAVIKPEHDAEFDVFLTQDRKPLRKEDRGEDVSVADDGETYVHVDQPRMYRLVRNERFGSHELKLSSTSDAFGLYAFTFGSCTQRD